MQEDQLIAAEKWCAVHLDSIHCFCLEGNLDYYIDHNNLIFTVDCVDMMDDMFLIFGFCCALCYLTAMGPGPHSIGKESPIHGAHAGSSTARDLLKPGRQYNLAQHDKSTPGSRKAFALCSILGVASSTS